VAAPPGLSRRRRDVLTGLKKTNACRALDALGIDYALRTYPVDESDLSAETAAAKLGLPTEQVWKTLCMRADDRSVLLAVIPAGYELDLKKLAAAAGKRAVAPVPLKELTALTGYIRGGVTALACKKPYPTFVDENALLFDRISVSAGQRGLQIVIAPSEYVRATLATLADLTRPKAAASGKLPA
jgi:Cys-tRNA(Pro)/Cys-tRNA(Cys) deacylase